MARPGPPEGFDVPVGLRLTQVARVVERAFDEALTAAGGSLPVWLILLNLKVRRPATQRELAEAVGVREATLTHHLAALEARGLIARTREAANKRVQVVALTADGEAAFLRLRDAAIAFDARLRAGIARLGPAPARRRARQARRQRAGRDSWGLTRRGTPARAVPERAAARRAAEGHGGGSRWTRRSR